MGDNTDLDSNAYVCTCLISALQTLLKHLNHMYHEFSINIQANQELSAAPWHPGCICEPVPWLS